MVQASDFGRLDVNADGHLSLNEFAADWFLGSFTTDGDAGGGGGGGGGGSFELWSSMDANEDGSISREEFEAATTAQAGVGGLSAGTGTVAIAADGAVGVVDNRQTNIFGLLDRNADGRVSKREWSIDWHSVPDKEQLWTVEDKDADGFVSWDEFGGPKGASPDDALRVSKSLKDEDTSLFARLDANGDWKIRQARKLRERANGRRPGACCVAG